MHVCLRISANRNNYSGLQRFDNRTFPIAYNEISICYDRSTVGYLSKETLLSTAQVSILVLKDLSLEHNQKDLR